MTHRSSSLSQRIAAPSRIELVLRRAGGNRFAIGAQVRATVGDRTLLRFVNGGNGFAGQSTTRLHIGLDAATVSRIIGREMIVPGSLRLPDVRRQVN